MPTVLELQQERKTIILNARAILDKADNEKRSITNEEKLQWDKMTTDALKLQENIDMRNKQEDMERQLNASAGRETRTTIIDDPTELRSAIEKYNGDKDTAYRSLKVYENSFRSWFKSGINGMSPDERRDLQADSNAAGGYTVLPTKLSEEIIIAKNNLLWIRQLAHKDTLLKAANLGTPTLAHDIDDSDWTTEILTGNDDTTMDFGRRDIIPNAHAKRIKVTNKLIRVSTLDILGIVKQRMTYKFAVTEEKAFLTADGSSKPLGVFYASANGVPTSRDVSTGNTSTSIGFDGLISAKMKLRQPYRRSKSTRWVFHRDAITQIMKLKNAVTGDYAWEVDTQVNEPDRILGIEVCESEYAPNTFTTGLYVGIVGDFSMYYIVDSLAMDMQRLNELYAETNQVGFIGRQEVDGAPVMPEAFARVKLA